MKIEKNINLLIVSILIIFCLSITASAHPGKTDQNGGHVDRSTGEYHFHHGYPAHKHYDIDGDGITDCQYDFDDQTSANIGSSSSKSNYEYDSYEYYYDDSEKQKQSNDEKKIDQPESPIAEGGDDVSALGVVGAIFEILFFLFMIPIGAIMISPVLILPFYFVQYIVSMMARHIFNVKSEDKCENIALSITLTIFFCFACIWLAVPIIDFFTEDPEKIAAMLILICIIIYASIWIYIFSKKHKEDLEKKIITLEKKEDKLDRENKYLKDEQERITQSNNEIGFTLTRKISELQDSYNLLQLSMSAKQKQVDGLTNSLREAKKARKILASERDSLQVELNFIAQNSDAQSLLSMRKEIEDLKKELSECKISCASEHEYAENLRDELKSVKEEYEELLLNISESLDPKSKVISLREKTHIDIPFDIYFINGNIPVRGEIEYNKPYGDFTVFMAERGRCYHCDKYCGNGFLYPKHAYDVIEKYPPCKNCGYRFHEKVPDWYKQYRSQYP